MEIYLDNAATTRPVISTAWTQHISTAWFNPSSAYAPAEKVFVDMKAPRRLLCDITGSGGSVVFTSGGTEANNTVIIPSFKKDAHYITSAIEHPSVYAAFKFIETLGARVDYVKPRNHVIHAEDVAALVRSDTALVSIMHVNNETGARNDIGAICRAVKAKNAHTLFHSDGVQALFKTPVTLDGSGIDYYTVSAHKINALKGTGALIAADTKRLRPFHHGGDQESMFRPGTENTLGIQAFSEALARGRHAFPTGLKHCEALSKRLSDGLRAIEGAMLIMPPDKVPHIVSVSFAGVRAEVLVRALGSKGIYIGTGAACSRGKISRVMLESGIDRDAAQGAVRISMSADNTAEEIDICLEEISAAVGQLRKLGRH